MPQLYITCPNTQKQVRTGIGMSEDDLAKAPIEGRELPCDACGETHTWSTQDAVFGPE